MYTNQEFEQLEEAAPPEPDHEGFTGYEDGDSYVVCDRKNPNAWIRSDVTERLSR